MIIMTGFGQLDWNALGGGITNWFCEFPESLNPWVGHFFEENFNNKTNNVKGPRQNCKQSNNRMVYQSKTEPFALLRLKFSFQSKHVEIVNPRGGPTPTRTRRQKSKAAPHCSTKGVRTKQTKMHTRHALFFAFLVCYYFLPSCFCASSFFTLLLIFCVCFFFSFIQIAQHRTWPRPGFVVWERACFFALLLFLSLFFFRTMKGLLVCLLLLLNSFCKVCLHFCAVAVRGCICAVCNVNLGLFFLFRWNSLHCVPCADLVQKGINKLLIACLLLFQFWKNRFKNYKQTIFFENNIHTFWIPTLLAPFKIGPKIQRNMFPEKLQHLSENR